MVKKDEILPDEYRNGVRLFNPSKPHGVIYADGFEEAKWDQEGILYRGDRTPILTDKKLHWKTRQKLEAENASGAS